MTARTQELPARTRRRSATWTVGSIAAVSLLAGALVACGAAEEARSIDSAGGLIAPSVTTAMQEPSLAPAGDTEALLADVRKINGQAPLALQAQAPEAAGARAGAALEAPSGAKNAAPAAPASGAPATAAQTALGTEPAMPSLDFLGRSIIRTGSMELQVESVSDSFERVSAIATGAGGFVAESRFFGRQGDPTVPPRTAVEDRAAPQTPVSRPPQGGASLTLRIPANRFDDVVQQLRGVAAEVRSINTGSQDVTGDVTDLESTIRNLRAVEARYIEMLGTARTTADILQIQDRLNQTRSQIERADGRLQGLRRLADMSTLTVSLNPVVPQVTPPSKPGVFAPVGEAWAASLEALQQLGLAVLIAGAFGWWMLPLIALALWAANRLLRNTGGRAPIATSIDTPQTTA